MALESVTVAFSGNLRRVHLGIPPSTADEAVSVAPCRPKPSKSFTEQIRISVVAGCKAENKDQGCGLLLPVKYYKEIEKQNLIFNQNQS